MKYGIDIKLYKDVLKKHYGVTSTELDNSNYYPGIYCNLSYFKHNGKWLCHDYVKIGMAVGPYNRTRTYAQGGADVRPLWFIGVDDYKNFENRIHKYLNQYRVHDVFGTEIFEITPKQSLNLLDEMVEVFNLKNRSNVREILIFDNNGISEKSILNINYNSDLNNVSNRVPKVNQDVWDKYFAQ